MEQSKKISPIEFRLSQRQFNVDYSPGNYFEKFRIEIIIQKLVQWFLLKYGIYLYIQRVQLRDDKLLFQVYFYLTHLQKRFFNKYIESFDSQATFDTNTSEDDKLIFSDPKLWTQITAVKKTLSRQGFVIGKAKKIRKLSWRIKRITRKGQAIPKSLIIKDFSFLALQNEVQEQIGNNKFENLYWNKKKIVEPSIALNFYFTYLFQHYFQVESVIIYKNLIKWFMSNKVLQREHKFLLYKTKYLQRNEWSYDLYFFIHVAIVYSNPTFILHILHQTIAAETKHTNYFRNLGDILSKFYWLKRGTVRGVKLLLHGVYNRHGRTRVWSWQVGEMNFTSDKSLIFYDWLPFWTRYGAFSVKIWIAYNEVTTKPLLLQIREIN